MRARTFAALLATTIFVANVHANAAQSNVASSSSPQAKSAQTTSTPAAATDDPTKKLGECRWSPQGSYLVCDQIVRMGAADDHRQFTVYSYDSKAGNYPFTTLADPGAKPTTGGITIKGNLWTYDDSSFESNGKKTLVRVTNEFTDAKTEVFKVVTSEDDGATWKPMLQGVARKVGD